MEKQHLTYFKIENFKRFDAFEMSNLGQFNLIVGDNNVGKTSVLEALLFDEDLDQLMVNFWNSLAARKIVDFTPGQTKPMSLPFIKNTKFWSYIFKTPTTSITTILNTKTYKLSTSEFKGLDANLQEGIRQQYGQALILDWAILSNEEDKKADIRGAFFETFPPELSKSYTPFQSANASYGYDLVSYFFDQINGDRESLKTIVYQLKNLIPNLEELRVHRSNSTDVLSVFLTDNNEIYPINRYGDGTVKLLRFLIQVVLAKGKRLMVDEIGSGIHFTRLVDYWKTIIQLCDQYKVQLFATTHSLECQQAFVEALEAPDMVKYQKDARNISLVENQKGEVEAVTFDFEQFEYALNIGFNTRGGKR